ncbi:zinc finger protein 341 [Galendromus occidentalis]|uniref:Zinc finger protein 341 n=1 Tax=Galendromus occidentalis TaxID=34638 RepID=A0AAJ6QWT4_9ACAR|nr:zinc finger protein 341 [Galendromus occidentalis]
MEDLSDAILREDISILRCPSPGPTFGAPADPRLFASNSMYQLPEAAYPTADQVYFDRQMPTVSFGFIPDLYECNDAVPSILEPDSSAFPSNVEPQTSFPSGDDTTEKRPIAASAKGHKRRPLPKAFTCAHCKKEFTKNFDFSQHMRSHTGEKPFLCIVCGLAFAQKCNVKKHLVTHMVWNPHRIHEESFTTTGHLPKETLRGNSMDKGFECRFCSTTSFATYADFRTHLKTHISERVFRCILPSCGETPGNADELLNHVKHHDVFKEYRCTPCDAVFPNLYQFSFHNHAHSRSEELGPQRNSGRRAQRFQYKCEICQERFSEPEDLKEHRESKGHLYNCPHCSSRFSEERYLRRHLAVHEAEIAFLCEHCGKGFKLKHHLASHILTHNEKAFSCPKCSRAFARPDQVVRHVKAVHEPRAFKCGSCSKTFSRKDKLQEHSKHRRTRCLPLQDTL